MPNIGSKKEKETKENKKEKHFVADACQSA
jgi:hypothetical protein